MPDELRPSEILELYWRENLSIEENAEFLDPVYFEQGGYFNAES